MIRVMYRWKVNPGQEAVFATAWTHGTKVIRATVKGVRGSLLLQSRTKPCEFVAIARWASVADWRAFRRGEKPDLEAFRTAAVITKTATKTSRNTPSSTRSGALWTRLTRKWRRCFRAPRGPRLA